MPRCSEISAATMPARSKAQKEARRERAREEASAHARVIAYLLEMVADRRQAMFANEEMAVRMERELA